MTYGPVVMMKNVLIAYNNCIKNDVYDYTQPAGTGAVQIAMMICS